MKDSYYECDRCPRWFKIVEGVEIAVSAKEALEYNITLIKNKNDCKTCKARKGDHTKKNYESKKCGYLQDYSRYSSNFKL